MIRTIKVTGRTGRFDVSSFLLTENENLFLRFAVKELRQGVFVCKIVYGEQERTVTLDETKTIEISAEWLNATQAEYLEIFLEYRKIDGSGVIIPSGRERGGYVIEPLIIERMDEGLTVKGWLSKIEEEIERTNLRMDELSARVKVFEDDGVPLGTETESEEIEIETEIESEILEGVIENEELEN